MNADRLYYANPYLKETVTTVLSCEETKGGWLVTIKDNLFYPTGGGQPCDLGTMGEANVLDVFEKDEEIFHLCDRSVPIGAEVLCKIDWERRFMLMQQHSGEHMLSGIIYSRFGYHNVGFHMGSDTITIDFSGEISYEQLQELEASVNAVIYQNIPCSIFYPDEQTLSTLAYRSKKELSGTVRLVQFQDIDLCACCGLHVKNSGEVGLVKLISTTKFHEGSRIEILCGARALEYLNTIFEQNRKISALLSAKPFATAAAAQRISEELKTAQYRCTCLENELFSKIAEEHIGCKDVLLFEKGLAPDALRRLCDAVTHSCNGLCAVFSEKDGGYSYAIGNTNGDLRELVRSLNAALNGRGGGKPNFVQGSVAATMDEISSFFANLNL